MSMIQNFSSHVARFVGCTVLGASLAFGLVGCGGGGGEMSVAPAGGKVTFNGAPVTGGSITLAPVGSGKGPAGKPASGAIQNDGTFKLSTYGNNDGAVIGKHKISFSAPAGETTTRPDGHSVQTPSPFDGLSVKTTDFEVKSGNNDIQIELTK